MAQVNIYAGICGFRTTITVISEDKKNVQLKIESECSNFRRLETELTHVDMYAEIVSPIGTGKTYEVFQKYCPHVACPVPYGVIKAMEVACGLALPCNATIEILE